MHNKGCFVPTSEVTLADGSQRQIKDIEVGQLVQSWDETERRITPARVKHILEYDRDAADVRSGPTARPGSSAWQSGRTGWA